MSKEVLIVRHSERLDEVDGRRWLRLVDENTSKRNRDSILNDPPITENGVEIARTASKSIKNIVQERSIANVRVYSSKLIRSIQTAYEIALELNVPLHVCSGLALTAAAVENANGTFEFLSVPEIQAMCPGVEIICCDSVESAHHVPNHYWLGAITAIADRDHFSIIVAHRETIRNFCKYRLKTPYCCMGVLHYDKSRLRDLAPGESHYKVSMKPHRLHSVLDMHGEVIEVVNHGSRK